MAYDYEKAFALTDDPFKPKQVLDGVTNPPAQDSIEIRPLLINAEKALELLYVPEAGRFAHYLEKFQDYARSENYRDDTNPPRVGANSSLLSLYGHEGTGKSTLAQVMICWLKKCKPIVGQWHIVDNWSFKTFDTAAEQIAALDQLQAQVTNQNSKYNCVVVDNLLPGALNKVLKMYEGVRAERIIFLFLLSKEPELFKELSGNGKTTIIPFYMIPLAADGAVAFIKHRIEMFRVKREPYNNIQWLAKYNLFPFEEKDIRSAFASGALYVNDEPYISLRQFNRTVARMIGARLKGLSNEFDIANSPEADIEKHMIRLMEGYEQLMKVA